MPNFVIVVQFCFWDAIVYVVHVETRNFASLHCVHNHLQSINKPLSGYKPPKGLPVQTGPAKIGFFNSDEEGNIYDQKTGKLKFKVLEYYE